MGLLFSVTEQKSLAFAVCRLRGSVLQAATLSISEVLQPLWKTIAQASNVEVGIDVLDHLLDPSRVLGGCFPPAHGGGAFCEAPTNPGNGRLM